MGELAAAPRRTSPVIKGVPTLVWVVLCTIGEVDIVELLVIAELLVMLLLPIVEVWFPMAFEFVAALAAPQPVSAVPASNVGINSGIHRFSILRPPLAIFVRGYTCAPKMFKPSYTT